MSVRSITLGFLITIILMSSSHIRAADLTKAILLDIPSEVAVNGSGEIDIADLVYVVDFMFNGGPPPVDCL